VLEVAQVQEERIVPKGDDWTDPKFLKLVIENDSRIDLISYYDRENYNYVNELRKSNFDLEIVKKEFYNRLKKHTKNNHGVECRKTGESVIGIYNKLSEILGRNEKLKGSSCNICYSCLISNGQFLG
jgi:hypothetical protein